MSILFTPVTKKNVQQAIDVAVQVFGEGDREAIEEEFKASVGLLSAVPMIESAIFYIVTFEGQPVGTTGYYYIKGHKKDVWLNWMGILPEFRGRKLGPAFVNEAFNQAASANKSTDNFRIWTTYEAPYDAARGLYNKMGFVEEPYKPGAKDAAKLVCVFSKRANPNGSKKFLWRDCAYPIDCETHVIPDLNKGLGLGNKPTKRNHRNSHP